MNDTYFGKFTSLEDVEKAFDLPAPFFDIIEIIYATSFTCGKHQGLTVDEVFIIFRKGDRFFEIFDHAELYTQFQWHPEEMAIGENFYKWVDTELQIPDEHKEI